jgi:hypothetical protein
MEFSRVRRMLAGLAASLVLGTATVVVSATPAAAALACSGWQQVGLWRHQACVASNTDATVDFTHKVQYLGTGTASKTASSNRSINGVWFTCVPTHTDSYSSGLTRQFSCTVPLTSGVTYGNSGTAQLVGTVFSPTIVG